MRAAAYVGAAFLLLYFCFYAYLVTCHAKAIFFERRNFQLASTSCLYMCMILYVRKTVLLEARHRGVV
jgi:hypothetical protein